MYKHSTGEASFALFLKPRLLVGDVAALNLVINVDHTRQLVPRIQYI